MYIYLLYPRIGNRDEANCRRRRLRVGGSRGRNSRPRVEASKSDAAVESLLPRDTHDVAQVFLPEQSVSMEARI